MGRDSNIVLIGMPGAGKSTVGVILAKRTARDFTDTDVLIQTEEGRSLQMILDAQGYLELRAIEERILLNLRLRKHVIATGGSAAYSEPAMLHLRRDGTVVYLRVPLDVLHTRVTDYGSRGIARRPDQSFEDLFAERAVLYERYADVIVECGEMNQDGVARAICRRICSD